MESGISNFLSDNSSNMDIAIEYFECRSEHCEMGGYAPPGTGAGADLSNLKNGLINSGWWQGGVSTASTNKTIDEVDRFVIMFNRNSIWKVE